MVNAIFENALENQPCILLFDECDGLFGSHALDDNSSSNDLKNALKTCLCNNDNAGLGVFCVAISNRPQSHFEKAQGII